MQATSTFKPETHPIPGLRGEADHHAAWLEYSLIMIEASFSLMLRRLRQQCEQSFRWQHDGGRQIGLQLLHQLGARVVVCSAGPVQDMASLGHPSDVFWIRVHLEKM